MYETVLDVIEAMKIDPEGVLLIRHTDGKDKRYRRAADAGYEFYYTSLQEPGFERKFEYFMVFEGEKAHDGVYPSRFLKMYRVVGPRTGRAKFLPSDYPNPIEYELDDSYIELREVSIPDDIKGFRIDWQSGTRVWDQYAVPRRKNAVPKQIIEIY